ncbi:MAG TPA: hypothetical protein VIL71_05650 [Spirillospora sp.]
MSGTTPRRHGLGGLLVILVVVGGLIFSYGLGRTPVARVCTEHAVSAPLTALVSLGTVSPSAEASVPDVRMAPHDPLTTTLTAPLREDSPGLPVDACLCVAVLFTLFLLGLAAARGRWSFRLPARAGWTAVLPPGVPHRPLSRHVLQVLRL